MARAAHHTLDVYGTELHLAVDQASWRAVGRRVPDLGDKVPDSLGQVSLRNVDTRNGRIIAHYIIWIHLEGTLDDRDLVDTVAHEAFHTARVILEEAGVHEKGNAEACAYLTGWIAGWAWEHIDRARVRGNENTAS